jgi:ribonucleotide monophosphatase NagD (HAD superfamily)
VVQGYGRTVGWPDLAEACVAVRGGADWVVTNTDATLPSSRGPLPGNGALVAALRFALSREPDLVVGKPAPGLFTAAAKRARASRPLVVGDRLDTDIEGAVRAGMDSLLVLTGVTQEAEVLAAPGYRRPTYVANDLSGLFTVDAH